MMKKLAKKIHVCMYTLMNFEKAADNNYLEAPPISRDLFEISPNFSLLNYGNTFEFSCVALILFTPYSL